MLSGRHSLNARAIRSRKTARLGSPVKVSNRAKRSFSASAAFRSVMSSARRTNPPLSICCKVNSRARPFCMSNTRAELSLPDNLASTRSTMLCTSTSEIRPASAMRSSKQRKLRPFSSQPGKPTSCDSLWFETTMLPLELNIHSPCGMLFNAASKRTREQRHITRCCRRIK